VWLEWGSFLLGPWVIFVLISVWKLCVSRLQEELPSQQFNMWVHPLQPSASEDNQKLTLLAPNRFIVDWVREKYLEKIKELYSELHDGVMPSIDVMVGDVRSAPVKSIQTQNRGVSSSSQVEPVAEVIKKTIQPRAKGKDSKATTEVRKTDSASMMKRRTNLNKAFTFDSFVEGKSNQMASAAAQQVAESPGAPGYNPLLLYGGVGLGKTHLMHAVGNAILKKNPDATVVYVHSERFFTEMVSGIRNKTIDEFKRFYRGVNALLIDDIQFFAGKEVSQDEFFHTFNALIENGQQIILTSDKYPKEIEGLEERLKSRFGWGLSQPLEPPELETRVAILKKKAEESGKELMDEVAFFIAQRIRSNVRELEGALKRVIAHSEFTGIPINIGLVKEALRDLLALQARQVNIDNIQRTVAEYYKVKVSDLLSARRSRSVARPRQIAMSLSKELTSHSYPEIGNAFGGRDHTTVLHACRRVAALREESIDIEEDYQNLLRSLTS